MKSIVEVGIRVNGALRRGTIPAARLLAEFLREDCGLTGTHLGCRQGICGSCTVLVDGEPVKSCLQLAVQVDGREVDTIEGLANPDGSLHPLQSAFLESGAVQCGFCIPGMLMTAKALLDREPDPAPERIRMEMANHLCRCTGYVKILTAVRRAALTMRSGKQEHPS